MAFLSNVLSVVHYDPSNDLRVFYAPVLCGEKRWSSTDTDRRFVTCKRCLKLLAKQESPSGDGGGKDPGERVG